MCACMCARFVLILPLFIIKWDGRKGRAVREENRRELRETLRKDSLGEGG